MPTMGSVTDRQISYCMTTFASARSFGVYMIAVVILYSIIHLGIPQYLKGYMGLNGYHADIDMVPMYREHIEHLTNGATDEDPLLISYIRHRFLDSPSKLPYNLIRPERVHFSEWEQSPFIDKFLEERRNGFFVECGAFNGEYGSNTLFFERNRNWTGLLIEANPNRYKDILMKNRKSYSLNGCLSVKSQSQRLNFDVTDAWGGIVDQFDEEHRQVVKKIHRTVQCFTLYSIMLAMGRNKIDYLSLDIEGPELLVLSTIPFDKLIIDVISVEYRVAGRKVNEPLTNEKLKEIRTFFRNIGNYREIGILPWFTNIKDLKQRTGNGVDVVFARES